LFHREKERGSQSLHRHFIEDMDQMFTKKNEARRIYKKKIYCDDAKG